jgi:hypothetical protein
MAIKKAERKRMLRVLDETMKRPPTRGQDDVRGGAGPFDPVNSRFGFVRYRRGWKRDPKTLG